MEDLYEGLGKKIITVIVSTLVGFFLKQAGCGSLVSSLGSGVAETTVEHTLDNPPTASSGNKRSTKTQPAKRLTEHSDNEQTKKNDRIRSIKRKKYVISIKNGTNNTLQFWLKDVRARASSTIVDMPGNKYKAILYTLAPGESQWIGKDEDFDLDFTLKSRGDFYGPCTLYSMTKEFYDRNEPKYIIKKKFLGGEYYIE